MPLYVYNTRILGTGGIETMDLDASVVLMRKARMQKIFESAASHNSALFRGLHLKHMRSRVSR